MSWEFVKLKKVLKQYRVTHIVENETEYKQVTISKHDGVKFRGTKEGRDIGRKRQFIIDLKQYPNTLMLVRQGVYEGAIGIAPPEVDECIATENMPMFSIEGINIGYLNLIIQSPYFKKKLEKIPTTGSAQKSIHERQILEIEIPFPSQKEQELIVDSFKKDQDRLNEISTELTHQLEVVKKLRQAFLRDAMQGKLVPQDPSDEPASVLLEKIKVEKEKLIGEKKIKKQKPLPPITEDEISFEIPEIWVWCRLGEITYTVSTGPFGTMLHKSDYVKDGIPLVNPMNIVDGKIIASHKMMVDEKTRERLKSYVLKKGDIVIGRRGEMGRCAAVTENEDGWLCGTGSFFIDLYFEIYRPYFVRALSSEASKKYLLGSSVGSTMNNLNHRILNNLPIPLPPFSEQRRIVTKLDKLMRYCDALEASIKTSQEQTALLLQQVLKEALEQKE